MSSSLSRLVWCRGARGRSPGARAARGAILLAFVAALGLCGAGCGGEKPKVERPPLPVEVIAAPVRDLEQIYTEMATLVAPDAAMLGAEVVGRVVLLPFDEGDDVKAGEELVRLDPAVPSAQVAESGDRVRQAEVSLMAARRDLERTRQLAEGGVASRQELDAAEDRVALAEASAAALRSGMGTSRAVLAKHVIRAPRAGVVTRRPVNLGEMVAPGQLLIEVAPIDVLRAECHVPERLASRLHEGDSVLVEVAGETTTGRIFRVSPSVDPGTRTVKIEIVVANALRRLRPGSFSRVQFVLERRAGVVAVPVSSVRTEVTGAKYVLVIAPGDSGTTVRRADIRVGLEAEGWVEVLEGLKQGEEIVTLGASMLTPGLRVEPRADRRPAYAPYAPGSPARDAVAR